MHSIREGGVVVLPRPDSKTVDVFTGKGWDKHTVFEVNNKQIKFVAGSALSQDEFKFFKGCL